MSQIKEARRALYRIINESPEFADVDRNYGIKSFGLESITVYGPDPNDTDWVALNVATREFSFTIPIFIQIRRKGDSDQASEDRADYLFDALLAGIRRDLRLGGSVMLPVELTLQEWETGNSGQGAVTRITLFVRCTSRF